MGLAENRARKAYIDLETEGLLTFSHGRLRRPRSQVAGPRVSEIAVAFDGVIDESLSGFTDIINREMLGRHGLTPEAGWTAAKVRDPNTGLPRSFYDELIGNKGPALWDISVAVERSTRGMEASTLNKIAREHAAQALEGTKFRSLEDFVTGLMDRVDSLPKDESLTLSGWNIASFDIPVLMKQLKGTAAGTRFSSAVSSGRVLVADAARNYHKLAFQQMLENPGFTPVVTDMRLIKDAVNRNLDVTLDSSKFVRKNIGLRRFVNDIARHADRRDAFMSRAQKWASRYTSKSERRAARSAAKKVAAMLQQIQGNTSDDLFESLMMVTKDLQSKYRSREFVIGDRSLSAYDIIGEMYRPKSSVYRATHVLGDPSRLVDKSLYGRVHGLQFVGGGQLGDVVSSLTKAMQMTEPFQEHRHLKGLVEFGESAHRAAKDTVASAAVDEIFAEATPELKENFRKVHFSPEAVRRRTAATVQKHAIDYAVGEGIVNVTGPAIKDRAALVGPKPVASGAAPGIFDLVKRAWSGMSPGQKLGVGVAGAAIAWLANRNRKRPEEDERRIEGIRKPNSRYAQIEGINPSELPGANVSWFGSGSHRYHLTASGLGQEQVRDRRVANKAAQEGEEAHRQLQQRMLQAGLLRSYETSIYGFGVSSRVDAILASGHPFEIKSLEHRHLMGLMGPRAKDIGQINYDILASGNDYGYLAYTSRGDTTKVKLYRITPDPGMLHRQTAALAEERRVRHRGPMMEYAAAYLSHNTIVGRGLNNLQSITHDLMSTLGLEESDPFAHYDIPTYNAGEFAEEAELESEMSQISGHGGYVQNLASNAQMSRIRDYGSKMVRINLFRGHNPRQVSPNRHSHAERFYGGL